MVRLAAHRRVVPPACLHHILAGVSMISPALSEDVEAALSVIDKALHMDGKATCYRRGFRNASSDCWMCRPLERARLTINAATLRAMAQILEEGYTEFGAQVRARELRKAAEIIEKGSA